MKITVRKIIYGVVFIILVVILGEIVRAGMGIYGRLPLLVDALVFGVAFVITEILDKYLIKSQLWKKEN